MGPEPSSPRVVSRIALAVVPLVLLVVLCEVVLWAAGAGEDDWLSLSRGFDHRASYFVPAPDGAGGWRTQMFETEALEVDIPPKGPRRRVVLLGGSNTQGFPGSELQRILNEQDGDPGWEVFNLGRQGYGSERVAILAGQVLPLQPDVVLVYAGHNEFTERGFALRLQEEGALSPVARLGDWLGGLRTTRVLSSALAPALADRGVDRRPEPRQPRDEAFKRLQYDETLQAFVAYRENLQRVVAVCAEADVGLVLCTVVGNDFAAPYVTNYSSETSAGDAEKHRRLLGRARRLIPGRFLEHLLPPIRLRQPDWGMTLRPEETASRRAQPPAPGRTAPTLRPLLGEFAEAPATSAPKAVSVAGAHWADPALWIPAVHDVLETYARLLVRDLTDAEREALKQARGLYGQAEVLVPDSPQAAFDHGLVAWLLGDDRGALTLLRRAADLDRAPRRGNDLSNGIVRAVAAGHVGEGDEGARDGTGGEAGGGAAGSPIQLVDIEQRFRDRSPGGLVGYEVMTDHCHLQPGVRPVLMADLAPAVIAAAARR